MLEEIQEIYRLLDFCGTPLFQAHNGADQQQFIALRLATCNLSIFPSFSKLHHTLQKI